MGLSEQLEQQFFDLLKKKAIEKLLTELALTSTGVIGRLVIWLGGLFFDKVLIHVWNDAALKYIHIINHNQLQAEINEVINADTLTDIADSFDDLS